MLSSLPFLFLNLLFIGSKAEIGPGEVGMGADLCIYRHVGAA
jgi:hypothetical protein